jgi:hypothetical protein
MPRPAVIGVDTRSGRQIERLNDRYPQTADTAHALAARQER